MTFKKTMTNSSIFSNVQMSNRNIYLNVLTHMCSHHYRKPDVCRVPNALPSAQYRALGKITICRVPTKKHSANRQHSAEENFAECQPRGTRQRWVCRVSRFRHSAKFGFAECHVAGTRQSLLPPSVVCLPTVFW